MNKIKPLGSRVLIKPTPVETTTDSGLILSDNATGKPMNGTVLAIGGKCSLINVNDIVLYPVNAGTPVGDYVILDEANILAII